MEMEMEVDELTLGMGRLMTAVCALEDTAARLASIELQATAERGREAELDARLAEAEATIVSLRAEGASLRAAGAGRKTSAAGVTALLAKEGGTGDAGALDAALESLSIEQRFAVKAGLMRSGLLG